MIVGLFVGGLPSYVVAEDLPTWQVDRDASFITAVSRAMGAPVEGKFQSFRADVQFDPDRPEMGRAVIVIDMNSFQTANADIEREIKRPKWFDTANHPEARFEASAFRSLDNGRYEADGNLTVKGMTKKITVPFVLSVGEAGGGGMVAQIDAEFTLRRLDFGIGSAEWTNTNLVADEVEIRIEARGRRID